MSFVGHFNALRLDTLAEHSLKSDADAARQSMARSKMSLTDFAQLISPAAAELLEPLCQKSQQLTQQRFGKVIRLFAPLYLSNECINN
jgi:2-iminoacetate synthase